MNLDGSNIAELDNLTEKKLRDQLIIVKFYGRKT